MTVQEVYQRGNNLVSTAIVALAGFAFFPELFLESEWQFKIDDAMIFLLGIRAIVWYKTGNNRFTRSKVPIILIIAAFIIKLAAILIEFKDKEDVGDDFGGLILFLLTSIFVIWLYKRSKKIKEII